MNPSWLASVGIGTYEQAQAYLQGRFDDWLKLSAGKRVLTATLAVRAKHPAVRAEGEHTPSSPDYTLGRFMLTQAPGTSPDERALLEDERNRQIRETAINTLHPAGMAPEHRHPDKIPTEAAPTGKGTVPDHAAKDVRARDMLTKVLLILRHGLKLYDPQAGKHVADFEPDVIRALAHGGRVNIRILALETKDEPAYALPEFLGLTTDSTKPELAEDATIRYFATHRSSFGPGKEAESREMKEQGGLPASLINMLTIGPSRPRLWGVDISGGGLGSKDWNGDMVLPNGSYGHVLLVFHRPTTMRDGALQIGIETISPHAASPVGYQHDFRSTEATANPESVLHGHKGDKVGSGGLSKNERLVDLREMARDATGADPGSPAKSWRHVLDSIKNEWDEQLRATQDGSPERRALYEELVGPRV
ncbi:PE-PGRS family protein [Streptomyces sp. NPDC056663]|uniref:PE-PGRS family protein n=1 Tax=Streptomyces sp. NPDC056663 TaxID=3345899 RepID=UPI003681AF70